MGKWKISICVIVFSLGAILVAFLLYNHQKKGFQVEDISLPSSGSLASVMNIDLAEIDRIHLSYGNTGVSRDVMKLEEIQDFFKMFDGVEFSDPQQISSSPSGYIFSAALYSKDRYVASFGFGLETIRIFPKDGVRVDYHSSKNFDHAEIKKIAEKYRLSSDYRNMQ